MISMTMISPVIQFKWQQQNKLQISKNDVNRFLYSTWAYVTNIVQNSCDQNG